MQAHQDRFFTSEVTLDEGQVVTGKPAQTKIAVSAWQLDLLYRPTHRVSPVFLQVFDCDGR